MSNKELILASIPVCKKCKVEMRTTEAGKETPGAHYLYHCPVCDVFTDDAYMGYYAPDLDAIREVAEEIRRLVPLKESNGAYQDAEWLDGWSFRLDAALNGGE